MRVIAGLLAAVAALSAAQFDAQSATAAADNPKLHLATTISPEARRELFAVGRLLTTSRTSGAAAGIPRTQAEWDAANAQTKLALAPLRESVLKATGVTVRADVLGGVPVLRIAPPTGHERSAALIYAHGGGYTAYDARSTTSIPALMAVATGREVISIDYTLAPRGTWKTAPAEVESVYRALLRAGQQPGATGMLGDSAGGGLIAAAVLKMRADGLPLPGALFLASPWTDLTMSGDTAYTLAPTDPGLDVARLTASAAAYAALADQKTPYASPVYGDFAGAFPPCLIQAGTRELLLSDSVRLYQALRTSGHDAVLDVYEGMPHVFQSIVINAPEGRTAITRAAAFFAQHLTRGSYH